MAGNGVPSNLTLFNKVKSHLQSWLLRFNWSAFEPTAGNYNYAYVEGFITTLTAADLYYILLPLISPLSTGITPSWIFSPPYNVPLVTTDRGTYPFYFNSTFITRKQAMLDALRTRIKNTWSSDWKSRLKNIQTANATTGDYFPYKGTISKVTINGVIQPNPSDYDITDSQWQTYLRSQIYSQYYTALATDLPATNLLINPDNDGKDEAYALANTANSGLKYGFPGHNHSNCGELYYMARGKALTAILPINLIRSELEGTPDSTWWVKQSLLPLVASYICHGGTMLAMTLTVINSLINVDDANDYWIFDFGNENMGFRNIADTNKGFILFRDYIDGNNTSRFPEATFDPVINPSQAATYALRYNNIVNDNTLPQTVKDDRLTNLIVQFFNPSRQTKMQAALPNHTLGALSIAEDHDSQNSDFGVNMTGNYENNIHQLLPLTSTGYNRIGSTGKFHGRFCTAAPEIFCYFDTGLIGNATYNVTFNEIWYYDESGRSWSLNVYKSGVKTKVLQVANTGTNEWLPATVAIVGMVGGGKLENGADFTLKTESGSDTKFELARFTRTAQTSTGTAGTYKLGAGSTTGCGNTDITLYTNGPFAVGKTVYYDGNLQNAVTGFTFIITNGNIYNLNSSTGVIGSDTGNDCVIGVSGVYKLGNTLSSICSVNSVTKYTNDSFAVGKVLYADASLTTIVTGSSYIVDTATNIVYNINTLTGVIGAPTTGICGAGILGTFRLSTSASAVCLSDSLPVYTNMAFGVGVFLFSDINLTTPLIGYTYLVNPENDYIYTVDSLTGQVTGITTQNCNASAYIPKADDFKVDVSVYLSDEFGCDCDCP